MENKAIGSGMDGLTINGDPTVSGNMGPLRERKGNRRIGRHEKQSGVKQSCEKRMRRRLLRGAMKQGLHPVVYPGPHKGVQLVPGRNQGSSLKAGRRLMRKQHKDETNDVPKSNKEQNGRMKERRRLKRFLARTGGDNLKTDMVSEDIDKPRLQKRLLKKDKPGKMNKRDRKAQINPTDISNDGNNTELSDRKLRRQKRKQEKIDKFIAMNGEYIQSISPDGTLKPKLVKRLMRKNKKQNMNRMTSPMTEEPEVRNSPPDHNGSKDKADLTTGEKKRRNEKRQKRKLRKSMKQIGMLPRFSKKMRRNRQKSLGPEMTIM